MEFQTQYNKKPATPEKNSGECLVEKSSYLSAEKRITNIMQAGVRLKEFRESQFDFPDEKSVDHTANDFTRSKNYDLADAFQDSLRVEVNLKEAAKEAEKIRKDALNTSQTAPEAPETK